MGKRRFPNKIAGGTAFPRVPPPLHHCPGRQRAKLWASRRLWRLSTFEREEAGRWLEVLERQLNTVTGVLE